MAAVVLLLAGARGMADDAPCSGVRPGAIVSRSAVPTMDPRDYATFGFVFEGSDRRTYSTTAGHVVLGFDGGERVWPAGSGIQAFDAEGARVGEYVYAIDTRTAPQPGLPAGADWSLIRLDEGVAANPEVCEVGGPTGVDARSIAATQPVVLEWHGGTWVGGRTGPPLPGPHRWVAPARAGISLGMPNPSRVTVIGHAFGGDSGAPVVSEDGGAVGIISGPPLPPGEIPVDGNAGVFVVSRLAPAIDRASVALGVELTLVTHVEAEAQPSR